jgi:ribose transport system substrate-binding protein
MLQLRYSPASPFVRKVLAFAHEAGLAAFGLALVLGGAAARADGERIAIFTKNAENPNYQAFLLGADRAAAGLGARTTHRVPKIPDDPTEQAALLAAQLDERPDAIVFNPADDKQMVEPLRRITNAGIPAIGFVNRMAGDFVTFVGADDVTLGQAAAGHLITALGGRGKLVIIEGSPTAATSRDRTQGFLAAIAAAPGVSLLGRESGHYLKSGGFDAMTRLLAAHREIDGVIAANDSMALGAIEAMAKAGRDPLIVGANGTMEAAKAIEAGVLLASVDYNGFKMGCLSAMAAIRHLRHLPVPREIILPAEIIDTHNVAAWLIPVEQRRCPPWEEIVRP